MQCTLEEERIGQRIGRESFSAHPLRQSVAAGKKKKEKRPDNGTSLGKECEGEESHSVNHLRFNDPTAPSISFDTVGEKRRKKTQSFIDGERDAGTRRREEGCR